MKKKSKQNKDDSENTVDNNAQCSDYGNWEFDDDCPICQAMKNGTADTLEGMKKACKKAWLQGECVEGEWVKEWKAKGLKPKKEKET